MLELKVIVHDFFQNVKVNGVEIYNEFSFQHELGIYLRSRFPNYKIQFERNISFFTNDTRTVKKEIDIVIYNADQSEKYAIELKHPLNGQYPEQMYSFAKDIKFMEELKDRDFNKTACVVLVSDRPFYEGKVNNGIYKYFREEFAVYGDVYKPTGTRKGIDFISLSRRHTVKWIRLDDIRRYFCIEIT